jgi:hypothetical protein
MLLIGYVYALASSRWLSLRAQAAVHVLLILSIAIYLFLSPVYAPGLTGLQQRNPTLGVLETLLFSIGLPFFIISASNPLLQSWFSRLQHYWAVDPYFLFAASNAGSLIALVAFPLVLEPSLGLNEQYKLWRVGFVVLGTLTCAIAFAHHDSALHITTRLCTKTLSLRSRRKHKAWGEARLCERNPRNQKQWNFEPMKWAAVRAPQILLAFFATLFCRPHSRA